MKIQNRIEEGPADEKKEVEEEKEEKEDEYVSHSTCKGPKVRWIAMGGSIQVIAIKTWKGKIFLHLLVDLVTAEICLPAKIHRNRPKWSDRAKTNRNLVRGGTRGWFVPI